MMKSGRQVASSEYQRTSTMVIQKLSITISGTAMRAARHVRPLGLWSLSSIVEVYLPADASVSFAVEGGLVSHHILEDSPKEQHRSDANGGVGEYGPSLVLEHLLDRGEADYVQKTSANESQHGSQPRTAGVADDQESDQGTQGGCKLNCGGYAE